jgi:ribosome-associated heat shock protein Hsp15
MYCFIVSGFTNALQTLAAEASMVTDACATNGAAMRPRLPRAAIGGGWHDAAIERTRVDIWLWAVRIYKTRSESTAACRGGHVRVNRAPAKASTQVKVGDRIDAFVGRPRILEVVTIIEKRVGAPVAAKCLIDHSPPVPVVKRQPRVAVREPGSGRPTKRERRELDRLRGE